ncbi:MAG: CotH kinase family protein, partial [Cyclobacteriaceae bacterium]|nr:CotH kinase family protein [Cyclobacteriaceae bacterium]
YLVIPTPAAKNNRTTSTQPLEKPALSLISGRYGGTQTVSITHPINGVDIRFTTDGSEPITTSPKYSSPISISRTTTVKVKAFHNSFLPSKTAYNTYFLNEHAFTLPVISISTNPTYLWDNKIGIYTDGTNGIPGNCTDTPMNWNQDWTRHAVLEYFNETGTREFDQAVDIRIGGACSRNFPQKSIVVKARDKYGKNTIDEALFSTKETNQYGGFILRNSGNDFYSTMFRDAMMQSLIIDQMDIDYMAYQPTIFYLNGDYWGIQNLREKIDADFIESNYGIKKNDLDLIETWGQALEGTTDAYYLYLDSLQQINLSDPNAFQFIDRHIDVQEYINYLAAEIYYCNTDWPGNNIKFWRQRSDNGKFRWILWDLDFGFSVYPALSYATHPTLEFATDPDNTDWPNPAWSTLHIRLLLQNPVFRNRFIQTLTSAMSTTFKPERVGQFINSFQNQLKDEMPHHTERWGMSVAGWNSEVQRLRNFATERYDYMQTHVAEFFGLDETVKISASALPADAGSFDFNGVVTNAIVDAPYYKGLTYQITPMPSPGFAFKGWSITKRESTNVQLIETGNTWRYFDQGSLPSASWMIESFDDNVWSQGEAQLGYGDGDEKTVVSFGSNSDNKFITTYFRKSFSVADTTGFGNPQAKLLFDDGVIIYLNGVEVYRNNIPGGAVGYNTLALQAIPAENVFTSFVIPKGLLKPGQNVIAAEVHQSSPQSSDISFDFALSTVILGNAVVLTSTLPEISDTAYTNVVLEALFEPANPVEGIIINEFTAAATWVKDDFDQNEDWIELYNTGTSAVNLAGLFITDDQAVKTKHKIKSGTGDEMILAPGAYKIFWADDDTEQGASHLNFKLSAEGEEIGLYQMIGYGINTLDETTFGIQPETVSHSRIPNATGPFVLTATVTPGAANVLEIPTGIEDSPDESFVVYPNPTTGDVYLASDVPIDNVKIFDSHGKLINEFTAVASGNLIPFASTNAGLYILVIRTGNKTTLKRVVKIQ